jgi:hypothetical protein
MGLTDGDYLKWYNDEIMRYRNQEWQLVSYSVAFSSAFVLFVRHSETKNIIDPLVASVTIATFVILLLMAEFHVHRRLSEYRQRRELLLKQNADHRAENVNETFLNGWFDTFFFVGFVLFPAAFGLAAARSVLTV